MSAPPQKRQGWDEKASVKGNCLPNSSLYLRFTRVQVVVENEPFRDRPLRLGNLFGRFQSVNFLIYSLDKLCKPLPGLYQSMPREASAIIRVFTWVARGVSKPNR